MPSLGVTSFTSCPISAAGPVDFLKPSQHVVIQYKPDATYSSWHAVLEKLRKAPVVTFGTPQELAAYQSFVTSCIRKAAELAAADKSWTDCVEAILVPLQRALELVKAGKTSSARCLAVELIGYAHLAQLAEQLKGGKGNALDRCIGELSAVIVRRFCAYHFGFCCFSEFQGVLELFLQGSLVSMSEQVDCGRVSHQTGMTETLRMSSSGSVIKSALFCRFQVNIPEAPVQLVAARPAAAVAAAPVVQGSSRYQLCR